MKYSELRRLLSKNDCTFETHKGGSGHIMVRRGNNTTQIPAHGQGKDLSKGLVHKILKDLELK